MVTANVVDDNAKLVHALGKLTEGKQDYWSFYGNSRRDFTHGLLQYPAMMVPQMVNSVLDQVCTINPAILRVADPFVGSGTVLTECMMRGLQFAGVDINPLAILLCRVKSGPFRIEELRHKANLLKIRIAEDIKTKVGIDFPNLDKWFAPDIQVALSKIRRGIEAENTAWARRFFWVALATTVRATSNSRTSTYKLHIRNEHLKKRISNPIHVFEATLEHNLQCYTKQAEMLGDRGRLDDGEYQQPIEVLMSDVRHIQAKDDWDLVVTSPPYGDNATTVPYGQFSYLPLQWIDLKDIDTSLGPDYLKSTHEIDSRSLGGSTKVTTMDLNNLCEQSKTLAEYLPHLKNQPRDRTNRVVAFFRDLNRSLGPIINGLKPNGLMVWTLGNRKVGKIAVPLDDILTDLLRELHVMQVHRLERTISSKRMAPKNNIADTMSKETILILRKVA